MATLKTHQTGDSMHIASFQNVLIVDVQGDVDLTRMKDIGRAHEILLRSFPEGIASLALLRPGTPVASPIARSEGTRFMKAIGTSLLMTVAVVEETGVLSLLLRSVFRGVSVLSGNSRFQVFANAGEGVRAVAPFLVGVSGQPLTELTAAVNAARRDFHPVVKPKSVSHRA